MPEIVVYGIERLRAIGYLTRFAGYLRQLGLSGEDIAALGTARSAEIDLIARRAGERAGWLANPDAHLRATGCALLLTVGEDCASRFDIDFLDQGKLLDRFAGLHHDVRLLIGIDPHASRSLERALDLLGHPRAAGVALSPFMAGVALDDEAYAPTLRALAQRGTSIWVHASAHFLARVPYDIGHPRHVDAALIRHPDLRVMIGHAGWPWTADACIVAIRHPGVAIELSTLPPSLLRVPGWSLEPLLAQRAALRQRIFFGSGAVSSPTRMQQLVDQLAALDLGDDLPSWRGEGLLHWIGA